MNTWIFQANPQIYDIDAALASLSEIMWLVKAHRDKINPGDEVFFWKSGAEAGILARATVLTPPGPMELNAPQFVLQPDKFNALEVRVRLRIDEVYAPPLSRDVLKADVRLADLSILKSPQGTNFAVTPEEAAAIHALREAHQSGADEIPAGAGAIELGSGSRVWAYSPGKRARFWEQTYREGIMAIGWDDVGDLRQYADHDALAKQLIEAYHLKGYPINDSRACYDFLHSMNAGDQVFVKRGLDEVVGYGVVTGDYEYRPERPIHRNVRQVRWELRGNWKCNKPVFPVKTLTDFTSYQDTVRYLTELIGVSEALTPVPQAPTLVPYSVGEALKGTAFDKAEFEDILDLWRMKKNLILQGPPGVGKTFLARRLAYTLIGHEMPSRVKMIQFHQSYSYEDFIQGYRPSATGFERKDGAFVRFCKDASHNQDSTYVFIIDEINRSNLSKIFGELLMLVKADKRGSKNSLALTYSTSEEEFYVPSNVYLLGMMNTADRSLALVDYALRRRFAFVELRPLFGSTVFTDFLIEGGAESKFVATVSARLQALNQAIAEDQNLGLGFVIGHSYFCGNGSALTEKVYIRAIRHEILPLLSEYWFDDPKLVKHWGEIMEATFDQA